MRLYLLVLAFVIESSNILSCSLEQMAVLYQGPLFNQSWWLILSISYFISLLDMIIHDIPTWCNTAFNTHLVIISSNGEVLKNKPVGFLQLIHLIAMASNLSQSSNKRNSNMANTLNNEGIIPLFGFRILVLCSLMARKVNHWIVSFIVFFQYKSLSWQSKNISEGLDMLASIFLSYAAASILSFHYWINAGWLIYFNRLSIYALNMLTIISLLALKSLWI